MSPLGIPAMSVAVDWDVEQLRLAVRAAGVALWAWNVDTNQLQLDSAGLALWGLPDGREVTFEDLSEHIHPADRDRVRAAFAATRAIVGPYEIDFRIMPKSEVRWISARGQGSDLNIADKMMFGVFLDVTARKQAEEGHELLAGEMSHRVKNLLAIAAGLTNISSRSASTTKDMARELIQRFNGAWTRARLGAPAPRDGWKGSPVWRFADHSCLAPYDDLGAFSGRIRVSVPRMGVGEAAATTLALVIHELATNSVKYGALSVETWHARHFVRVSWAGCCRRLDRTWRSSRRCSGRWWRLRQ